MPWLWWRRERRKTPDGGDVIVSDRIFRVGWRRRRPKVLNVGDENLWNAANVVVVITNAPRSAQDRSPGYDILIGGLGSVAGAALWWLIDNYGSIGVDLIKLWIAAL